MNELFTQSNTLLHYLASGMEIISILLNVHLIVFLIFRKFTNKKIVFMLKLLSIGNAIWLILQFLLYQFAFQNTRWITISNTFGLSLTYINVFVNLQIFKKFSPLSLFWNKKRVQVIQIVMLMFYLVFGWSYCLVELGLFNFDMDKISYGIFGFLITINLIVDNFMQLLSMKLVKEDSLKKRTDFLAIDRKKFDSFAYRFQMGLIGLTTRNMTIIIVCLLLIFNSFIVIMDMNTMIMLSRIILIQFSFHSMIYKSVFNSLLYMKFSKHVRVPDPMKNEEKNFKQQTDLAGAFEINIKQLNIVNEKHTSGRPLSKTSDMGKTTKSRVDMSDKNSMASGYDSKILSTKETVEEN